jgi:hypothetical protein
MFLFAVTDHSPLIHRQKHNEAGIRDTPGDERRLNVLRDSSDVQATR